MNVITLKSRYNDIYQLIPIEDNKYKFEGNIDYMRVGFKDKTMDIIDFINPSGGPMIHIGDSVGNKKIEKIEIIDTNYIITLE